MDLDDKTENKILVGGAIAAAAWAVVWLGAVVAVGWTIIHFVRKFW